MSFGYPERFFPRRKYDLQRMRMFALTTSWISMFYNGIEPVVSIGPGADVVSRALIVFGVQSVVEMLSATLVIYCFRRELNDNTSSNLLLEKRATFIINVLDREHQKLKFLEKFQNNLSVSGRQRNDFA